MPIDGVLRLGHVLLAVADVEASFRHYHDFLGLTEVDRDRRGRVYLKALDEWDRFSLVIRKSSHPRIEAVGFKLSSAHQMVTIRDRLREFGVKRAIVEAGELNGCGERLRFELPGTPQLEVFWQKDQVTSDRVVVNPKQSVSEHGFLPRRLAAAGVFSSALPRACEVLQGTLGLRVTEEIQVGADLCACALTAATAPLDLRLVIQAEAAGLVFAVRDRGALLSLADNAMNAGIEVREYPRRQLPGGHFATTLVDPDGIRNEFAAVESTRYADEPTTRWVAPVER